MHAKLEDLLALRDGEAPPDAAAHVAGCTSCRAELRHLRDTQARLRTLPVHEPPPQSWERIRRARRHATVQQRWRQSGVVALAASVVVALALVVTQPSDVPVTPSASELSLLYAQSRELEAVLAQLDADSRVLDLRTAGAIVELEDRIAAVDDHLARGSTLEPPMTEALWRHRVELMQALVGVHAAHAQPAVFEGVY